MLLVEQVRQVSDEQSLIDDSTEYTGSSTSWATLHDYGNITLDEDTFIIFNFEFDNNLDYDSYGRLKIGDYYVWGIHQDGQSSTKRTGLVWLPSGTYNVKVEAQSDGGLSRVRNFKLGKVKFSDAVGEELTTYSGQISKQVSSRTTPIGDLNEAVFVVNAFAYTSGAQTNFENVGDSLTNGVSLKVDGSQVNWTERYQDSDGKENAHAVYYGVLSVGSSHTFEIVKDNADTVVHISIVACPWILCGDDFEPVSLDFPQGSTLYVTFEPLDEDPTKTVKLGKKRAVSFGDSTDYYSTSSGTGILNYNYTFETVQVGEVGLYVSGKGGCISILGVDVR